MSNSTTEPMVSSSFLTEPRCSDILSAASGSRQFSLPMSVDGSSRLSLSSSNRGLARTSPTLCRCAEQAQPASSMRAFT